MTEEDKRIDDRSDGSDSEDEAPATGSGKQSAVVIPDMKETQVDVTTLNPLTPSVIVKRATIVRPRIALPGLSLTLHYRILARLAM